MKINHILNFFIFLLILINLLKVEAKQADIIKQIQNRISYVNNSNNNKERFKNSFKYINFSNNNTNTKNTKNNGFSQWIEENTCVFCVTVVLLFFALFILISLIIVRFACENKKKKNISRYRPPPAHIEYLENSIDDDELLY